MKKAWDTHRLCARCETTRTKDKHCARCAPIVRREEKVDKDGLTAKQRAAYVQKAKDRYEEEGSIEIDPNAKLSVGMDKGVYVEAWVWVDDD